ncbi:MAG TPA: lysylphosphatidylglycerol synthase transmembrane domain-containing protein [Gaiellaceae bacterium]|nr:lysylphosphatidylglycerol synthase transmembrane domain-containing protein [Gaiellaceae bacterium]
MSAASAAPTKSPEKRFRWKRLLAWVLVIVLIGAMANLLGWDIRGWLKQVWDTITSITFAELMAAIVLKTLQTTLTGYGWYSILKHAYPGEVRRLDILACYAASVALNGILPANLGTLVMLLMFTSIIASATFAGILGGYAVQKIFFTAIGAFTWLYLFLSVGGSFELKFSFVKDHPVACVIIVGGGGLLIYMLASRWWPKVTEWWNEAKTGGGIVAKPGAYFLRVFLPSLLAWVASLGVMCVFLHAYDIPISFHTLMRINAGNSIANVTSVTPGGAGVNQAFNVASLKGVTSSANATAYSVAQQLVTTAWNIVFAIIMVAWAFGWTGGRALVETSYGQAKEKAAEQKAAHDERKAAKKAAKAEN